MIDKALSLFTIKARELVTIILSIYIFCEYLAIFGTVSGGVSNIGSCLQFIELHEAGRWIISLQTRLATSNIAQYINYIFPTWLSIATLYFIALYTKKTPSNLLPRPALTTSFFWALGSDFSNEHTFLSTYTYIIVITLAFILIINIIKQEHPLARTAHATFACILGCPIFLLLAPVIILTRETPKDK